MTVDYRSLFVRVQRGVPNHLTPTHILGAPRIASTGSYDTPSYLVFGHQAAVTPPQHVANETEMPAKASERRRFRIRSSISRNQPTVSNNGPHMYTDDLKASLSLPVASTPPGWTTLIF